jgi:hypothetical protein
MLDVSERTGLVLVLAMGCLSCVDADSSSGEQQTSADLDNSPGGEGCVISSCEAGDECCLSVRANASDNEQSNYTVRPELVQSLVIEEQVTATFAFTAMGQFGDVVYDLNAEVVLQRLVFTGHVDGVVPSILTASIGSGSGEACFYGAAVMRRPSVSSAVRERTVFELDGSGSCNGQPEVGRGSQITFGVQSTAAGEASLTIEQVELVPRQ